MTLRLDIEKMRELAKDHTFKQIADYFGCSEYKIMQDCIRNNIPKVDGRTKNKDIITWEHYPACPAI